MKRTAALTLAFGIACLSGWGYLHLNLLAELVGAPGGLVYLMISQTNSEPPAAKLVLEFTYLAANTAFYYAIIRFSQKRIWPETAPR